MRFLPSALAGLLSLAPALVPTLAQAHFQEVIPDPPLATQESGGAVSLSLTFTHPMENGPAMDMAPPVAFGVMSEGEKTSLLDALEETRVDDKAAYRASFTAPGPADYIFYLEPAPYWEPAEGVMIVHYTKVVVDAFGADEGWDAMVGFPVEIQPLTRPFGLYTGNVFSGVVTRDGAAVPFAEVEVEYKSEGAIAPPADVFTTQVIRADANGTFHYAMPRAGWWGFAALLEGPETMTNPEGAEVPVEQGALLWVNTVDMPRP